jgi:hypothetical protein
MDLSHIELAPEKLARGCYWEIWREANGTLGGQPIAAPAKAPWLLIVPRGITYERAVRDEEAPHRERLRDDKVPAEERFAWLCRAHGRVTLKGWGNLQEGGVDLPWSETKAIELMLDDRWKALREFVLVAFGHLAAAAKQEVEKAEGN